MKRILIAVAAAAVAVTAWTGGGASASPVNLFTGDGTYSGGGTVVFGHSACAGQTALTAVGSDEFEGDFVGAGQAPINRGSWSGTACVEFDGTVVSGAIEITTTIGQLRGVLTDQFGSCGFEFHDTVFTYTITGGTGAYQGATGTLVQTGFTVCHGLSFETCGTFHASIER
jgi:hypothetical protein